MFLVLIGLKHREILKARGFQFFFFSDSLSKSSREDLIWGRITSCPPISLFLYCTSRSRAVPTLLHIPAYGHNDWLWILISHRKWLHVSLVYPAHLTHPSVQGLLAFIQPIYSRVGNETANLHGLGFGKITGLTFVLV